jgi:electron transfer flavoprotein alpha/beta subunit
MAAKKKPVEKIEVASLGIDEGADPYYTVSKLELPPEKAAGTIIQGEDDPAAAAAELVKALRNEAKAI